MLVVMIRVLDRIYIIGIRIGISLKMLTQRDKGRESIGPLPSTFDTIHPIDLIFGTYNQSSLHF